MLCPRHRWGKGSSERQSHVPKEEHGWTQAQVWLSLKPVLLPPEGPGLPSNLSALRVLSSEGPFGTSL